MPSTEPHREQEQPKAAPKPTRRWRVWNVGPWGLLMLTLAGSCGAWSWAFDLCSHFRWYYFVIALVWNVAVLRRYRRPMFWALAVTVVWNGWLLLPYYVPAAAPPAYVEGAQVSLISLNVYTANQNKPAVLDYLRRRQPDLVVVMEVDDRWAAALTELQDVYPHQFVQPRPDNFGIGVLSRWPLTEPRFVEFAKTQVPNVVTMFERDGSPFVLVATHPLPPIGAERTRERNEQLRAVADFVKHSPLPCVVAGDFNATPWSSAFRDFTSFSGLRDSALGRGVQGSWNAKHPLVRIPIDHVFVPREAVVTRRVVGPYVGSDHFPVEATIAFP
jgi:endonuclease/exonuclease/phosphatase (EEP) superfamily protein YafD